MGELGRNVEFAANLPWFQRLFTDQELQAGRSRLALHDFPPQVAERLGRGWEVLVQRVCARTVAGPPSGEIPPRSAATAT